MSMHTVELCTINDMRRMLEYTFQNTVDSRNKPLHYSTKKHGTEEYNKYIHCPGESKGKSFKKTST